VSTNDTAIAVSEVEIRRYLDGTFLVAIYPYQAALNESPLRSLILFNDGRGLNRSKPIYELNFSPDALFRDMEETYIPGSLELPAYIRTTYNTARHFAAKCEPQTRGVKGRDIYQWLYEHHRVKEEMFCLLMEKLIEMGLIKESD
jgi:hypothetical protein